MLLIWKGFRQNDLGWKLGFNLNGLGWEVV